MSSSSRSRRTTRGGRKAQEDSSPETAGEAQGPVMSPEEIDEVCALGATYLELTPPSAAFVDPTMGPPAAPAKKSGAKGKTSKPPATGGAPGASRAELLKRMIGSPLNASGPMTDSLLASLHAAIDLEGEPSVEFTRGFISSNTAHRTTWEEIQSKSLRRSSEFANESYPRLMEKIVAMSEQIKALQKSLAASKEEEKRMDRALALSTAMSKTSVSPPPAKTKKRNWYGGCLKGREPNTLTHPMPHEILRGLLDNGELKLFISGAWPCDQRKKVVSLLVQKGNAGLCKSMLKKPDKIPVFLRDVFRIGFHVPEGAPVDLNSIPSWEDTIVMAAL